VIKDYPQGEGYWNFWERRVKIIGLKGGRNEQELDGWFRS